MENVLEIAKYILSLDKDNQIFNDKIIILNNRRCYEGNVRLNKYLHIMQMVYIAMNNQKLFSDYLYAYDNGVIIEDVMNNYKHLKKEKNSFKVNNDDIKIYLKKMYNILKYAPLTDLITISHQDIEWQQKHKNYDKNKQLMNIENQIENYKILCADFIDLYNND